jgi:two-component system cell cycle sensor histidine kinase/response regulator CckA
VEFNIKKIEESLRVQKLENLGLLAGGIGHDLNNILTVIMGNISISKARLKGNDWFFERLAEAEIATLQAKELACQLLTFVRGGAPFKKIILITEFLRQAVQFTLRGSNIRSEFIFKDDILPVEIDETHMSQVIQNLVINAKQAMPEGGTIQIRAENINVLSDYENGLPIKMGRYVKISVQDHGFGISNEDLPKIFEPFFTTKRQGTGLGLSISSSIIQRHGGNMTVESEFGAGTTFFFYLPASNQKSIRQDKAEEDLIKGKGRVLLIDDEEGILKVTTEMLNYLGYETDFSCSGSEGLVKSQEAINSGRRYDVIVIDLTIPGDIGGLKLFRRIKEIDPQVKVVVSSGYSNLSVITNFKFHGFSGAIKKPYSIFEVSKVLDAIVANETSQ